MKKKIAFTVLWILVFSVIAFFLSMVMFAILGKSGVSETTPWLGIFGVVWSWTLLSVPVIALILCIRGALPGTRRQN
jgi:uncharacterized membrane protein